MSSIEQYGPEGISPLLVNAQQTVEAARRLQVRSGKLGFMFLITDSKLGMTFAGIASGAPASSEKRTRNQANARKAYDAISRISIRIFLSDREREDVDGRLAQLRSALNALGEFF